MKKNIIKRNGIIYLNGFDETFDWCTNIYDEKKNCNVSYFPLNLITREHFKSDILPIIKSGLCDIDTNLYNEIRFFQQNPEEISPIQFSSYPSGLLLKEHQLEAINLMLKHKKYGFFLGTGSGKTLIAITWLMNVKPNSCLIITPQKVIGQYKTELQKYIPNNNYEVTNYEQLSKYIDKTYEAIVLDESHRAKNFTSHINVYCRMLSKKSKYTYLFTGTPQDKSRHEILSQLAILDERVMPVKTKIYERYFNINDYFQPESEKRDRKEELTAIINCYTWGKKTEDVVKLTDEHIEVIKCPHPIKYYDELFKHRVINKGEDVCEGDNKGVLRVALRGICSGYINWTKPDGTETKETFDSGKTKALHDLVTKIDRGIIYYEFTASIDEIQKVLEQIGKTYVVVNGTCNEKKSTNLIEKFKNNEADYLVIQSKSGNAGLDLTKVNDIIFYALPESYIVYTQAKARIRRIGQTKVCNYYHLISENTVEEAIYSTLGKKKSFTEKIFLQYKQKGDKEQWKTNQNN
jgi:SNF2 family DNA or RNA helicase